MACSSRTSWRAIAAYYTPFGVRGSFAGITNDGPRGLPPASSEIKALIFSKRGNAMDIVLGIVTAVGHAIELVFAYVESHHWIFGLVLIGYLFYLHDRSLHARFDALDKRIDEVRRRLAVDY
jgi:hypothetical protein